MEEVMGIDEMSWPSVDDEIPVKHTVTTVGSTDESAEKSKKKREYSKLALTAMIVLWFVGALFGMAVVVWQLISGAYSVGLSELLNYIGMPMTGGIVGYLVKSAVENREKIKGSSGDNGRAE